VKTKIYCLVILALLFTASRRGQAEIYFIDQKQEVISQSRWSLAEWLDQRDRMRLMDLWLAIHSPSPYEFYVGTTFQNGYLTGGSYASMWNVQAVAYASIFGIEAQRNFSSYQPNYVLMGHLRVFGRHAQDTNITFEGGAREQDIGQDQAWNPLVGVAISIYINRFFGIDGLYRHYFTATYSGGAVLGDRYEAGGFIDFKFVRFDGGYFDEYDQVQGLTGITRRGPYLGFKIFF
jgi:hypothetical protein